MVNAKVNPADGAGALVDATSGHGLLRGSAEEQALQKSQASEPQARPGDAELEASDAGRGARIAHLGERKSTPGIPVPAAGTKTTVRVTAAGEHGQAGSSRAPGDAINAASAPSRAGTESGRPSTTQKQPLDQQAGNGTTRQASVPVDGIDGRSTATSELAPAGTNPTPPTGSSKLGSVSCEDRAEQARGNGKDSNSMLRASIENSRSRSGGSAPRPAPRKSPQGTEGPDRSEDADLRAGRPDQKNESGSSPQARHSAEQQVHHKVHFVVTGKKRKLAADPGDSDSSSERSPNPSREQGTATAGRRVRSTILAGAERAGAAKATVLYFTWAVLLWGVLFILASAASGTTSGDARMWSVLMLRVVVAGTLATVSRVLTLDTAA